MDDLGQSTSSTFQTDADSPEISSFRKEVEIFHESVIEDSTCLSADLDVFARDEFSNTEIMASTSNGMDLNGENLASSDPTMSNSEYSTKQDAIISVDEDFRESAFLEVETRPTDGIPSINEATPNLSALVGRIKSMSEIVDRNSSSRPDGSATDECTLNELHDVNSNKSDLVLSNTGDEFGESNPSVVSERLKVSTSSIGNPPDAELEHANSFGDMLSHEDSFVDKQSKHISSFQDNGFGDFEAFADISEAAIPIEQGASVLDKLDSPVEKGIDPSQFQDTSATKNCFTTVSDNRGMALVTDDSVPILPEDATNDEEFGDFGGFEFGDPPADELIEASNVMDDANEEGDEFGEFGDFNAFEEEPVPPVMASGSLPTETSSVDVDAGNEFGDFNEFEVFDSAPDSIQPEEIGATTKSGSKSQQMSFLNERVRQMFQGVFAYNDPAAFSVGDGGTCSRLPFDVPMSKILSALSPPREVDPTHTHKSEQELATLMAFYANLPVSPPSTVLSKEKWYPYSQYEFNRDGSPYVPMVEIVPTSSVPEVLSIELPTGFEAIDSSSSTTIPSPPLPVSTNRSTPTVVVDFPSTQTRVNHGTEHDSQHGNGESFEPDLSQLSDEGKRFMESIPDLSYMLNSTLSLPKA